ncbi:hypothetical protein DMP14_06015 [Pseudonocardia sp. Ae707_Ps2]
MGVPQVGDLDPDPRCDQQRRGRLGAAQHGGEDDRVDEGDHLQGVGPLGQGFAVGVLVGVGQVRRRMRKPAPHSPD